MIDVGKLSVIDTFSPEGFYSTRNIIGGKVVEQLVAALVKDLDDEKNPQQLRQDLNTQFSLQELTITTSEEEPLLVSFIAQGLLYKVAVIPSTEWVTVASMNLAEISIMGRNLLLLFALTSLFLGGVTTGLVLFLAHQVSASIAQKNADVVSEEQYQQKEAQRLQKEEQR